MASLAAVRPGKAGAAVIHDVDESLRELIRRDVLNGAGVEVSFDTPSKEWSARRNTPTLNLYLYDIHEDLQRRGVQYEDVRNGDGLVVERVMPPRRFKLSYLVTAWTQRAEDEHRLLSAVLGCFMRSDALPADILQGALADAGVPVRCTVALPLPPERSISDVWSALGGELKASLDLVVTAPFPSGRYLPVGPPVTEEPFVRVGQGDGQPEEAPRRGRPGGGPKMADLIAAGPSAGEERVDSGKMKAGRRLEMRSFPKP